MEKISPLRASLKAFEQFKAQRAQKRQESQNPNATNPFGLTFKGSMIKMDVLNHKLLRCKKQKKITDLKKTSKKRGNLLQVLGFQLLAD